jgi:pilus assembly protein CpaF
VDPVSRAAALDELAGSLRERMLARAGDAARLGDADPQAGIRELVEREVALLDPADREELVARVAERSFGLGPLEPLCDARLPDGIDRARQSFWVGDRARFHGEVSSGSG